MVQTKRALAKAALGMEMDTGQARNACRRMNVQPGQQATHC
jgi:hypothetical protein